MSAVGCMRCVMRAGNDDLHDRFVGAVTVLGVIECELDRIHVGCNEHAAVGIVDAVKFGHVVERQVQLGNVAVATQSADAVRKADVEVFDANELEKGPFRIRSRNDAVRSDLLAVGHLHARNNETVSAAVDQHPINRCGTANLGAGCLGRPGKRRGKAPDAPRRNLVNAAGIAGPPIQHGEYGAVR